MPHFSPKGNDTYICQRCALVFDSVDFPSQWKPRITGHANAGNVCPSCAKCEVWLFRLRTTKDHSLAAKWMKNTFTACDIRWVDVTTGNDIEVLLEVVAPPGTSAEWVMSRAAFLSNSTVQLDEVKLD